MDSFGYSIVATSDGGCALTGHTTAPGARELDLMVSRLGRRPPG